MALSVVALNLKAGFFAIATYICIGVNISRFVKPDGLKDMALTILTKWFVQLLEKNTLQNLHPSSSLTAFVSFTAGPVFVGLLVK